MSDDSHASETLSLSDSYTTTIEISSSYSSKSPVNSLVHVHHHASTMSPTLGSVSDTQTRKVIVLSNSPSPSSIMTISSGMALVLTPIAKSIKRELVPTCSMGHTPQKRASYAVCQLVLNMFRDGTPADGVSRKRNPSPTPVSGDPEVTSSEVPPDDAKK
ncbi:hypothetical protein CJ030_MR4G009598 [Morella rubra]|nr:hypothetical protein CJ030_MR7G010722 [Morella rubra]KAB1216066.1 hypothetical protein CJ030_MR4G009598 [Morella rubra]